MNSTITATIVGTVTIPEGETHRRDISETASRYEEVLLTAGVYDVIASSYPHATHEVHLTIRVTGTITSRYDGSEYFGMPIGNSPQHENHPMVGQLSTFTYRIGAGDVDWNEDASRLLCWRWLTGIRRLSAYDNPARPVVTDSHRSLFWQENLSRVSFRIDGVIPEFFSEAQPFVDRLNELDTDEAWNVYCDRDTGRPSFDSPVHVGRDNKPFTSRHYS